ncbi:MAG: folate-binding protein YgfZ [Anaerolineales bacterium]
MELTTLNLHSLHAARNAAALYWWQPTGCLQLRGQDRIAFLQRQTTNDMRRLTSGGALVTVLTNATARILDVLTVLQPNPETLLLLPLYPQATLRFLKSRIFFMDKVELTDVSAAYRLAHLFGAHAAQTLSALGFEPPSENHFSRNPAESFAFALHGWRIPAYGLLISADDASTELARLPELTSATLESLRLWAGIPGLQAELTPEKFTPLEVGLGWAVAENKGCYTGQEVLARQVTYDKITRSLVHLHAQVALAVGQTILGAEGKPAGEITSAAYLPDEGWYALAMLRRPHFEPNIRLSTQAGDTLERIR